MSRSGTNAGISNKKQGKKEQMEEGKKGKKQVSTRENDWTKVFH